MPCCCTRGGSSTASSLAILSGIAPNGGLYVPSSLPKLSYADQVSLADLPYADRAARILSGLLDDFTADEVNTAVQSAYLHFDNPAVAPVVQIRDNTFVLELFHGPTLAFKDMALQLLPRLMALSACKNKESRDISVLVATSGDTGKAALEGFKDVPGTSCTVFYPLGGVSDIQELQMTTTGGANTHVIGLRGNFDDAQSGLKRLFVNPGFISRMSASGKVISSANSINLGRLLPQIAYYFSACADLQKRGGITWQNGINVIVPTGNFGNILAAWYARLMGAPIKKLICASNRNSVLADFIKTGCYNSNRTFYTTISPSMDILVSSNLERLLFDLSGRDGQCVGKWMEDLASTGRFDIGPDRLRVMNEVFVGDYADDSATRKAIDRVWREDRYLFDPHTAVAEEVLRQYRSDTSDQTPALIIATASPYKFSADVLQAAGFEGGNAFESAERLSEATGIPVPLSIRALRHLPVRHSAVCDVSGMEAAILKALE
jgi:threonine synthase